MNTSNQALERYLARLRRALQDVDSEEQNEILSDIRCLIQERHQAAGNETKAMEALLERLGPPEALADSYRVEGLLTRAAHSTAPSLLAQAALRWAMSGFQGFLTACVAFAGYGLVFIFFFTIFLKILHPEVGLWVGNGQFHIGSIQPVPPGVREVLGNWAFPLCLVLGLLVYVLTNYAVRWLIRRRDSSGRPLLH